VTLAELTPPSERRGVDRRGRPCGSTPPESQAARLDQEAVRLRNPNLTMRGRRDRGLALFCASRQIGFGELACPGAGTGSSSASAAASPPRTRRRSARARRSLRGASCSCADATARGRESGLSHEQTYRSKYGHNGRYQESARRPGRQGLRGRSPHQRVMSRPTPSAYRHGRPKRHPSRVDFAQECFC
jgi:hypothetical protein